MSSRVKDCLIAPLDLLITDIGQINDAELREMLEVSMIATAVEKGNDENVRIWNGFFRCRIRTFDESRNWISAACAFAEATGNTIIKELIKAVQLVTEEPGLYVQRHAERDNGFIQIVEALEPGLKERQLRQ